MRILEKRNGTEVSGTIILLGDLKDEPVQVGGVSGVLVKADAKRRWSDLDTGVTREDLPSLSLSTAGDGD